MQRNFDVTWLNEISGAVISKHSDGDVEYQEEWHEVIAGDAIARDASPLHLQDLPMPYPQGELPLCVLRSFTSALWLYGDDNCACQELLELEDNFFELKLSQTGALIIPKKWVCPRMDMLRSTVATSSNLKWNAHWLTGGYQPSLSSDSITSRLLKLLPTIHQILLVRLQGIDKSTSHCVCIVRKQFDSFASDVSHATERLPSGILSFNANITSDAVLT